MERTVEDGTVRERVHDERRESEERESDGDVRFVSLLSAMNTPLVALILPYSSFSCVRCARAEKTITEENGTKSTRGKQQRTTRPLQRVRWERSGP